MFDAISACGRLDSEPFYVDPVVILARAHKRALTTWGEAQDEAARIITTVPLAAQGDPRVEETSGYAAAHERSMRLLEPVLEIEERLEQTTATTVAGLLVQAKLLEATLPSSARGRNRLLATIIAGLEGMTVGLG
jgi:hypothetical protein